MNNLDQSATLYATLFMLSILLTISSALYIFWQWRKFKAEEKTQIYIKPNMQIVHHLDLLRKCGFPAISKHDKDKSPDIDNGHINIWYFKLSMMAQNVDLETFSKKQWETIQYIMPVNIPDWVDKHKDFSSDEIDILNKVLPLASVLFERIELTTEEFNHG